MLSKIWPTSKGASPRAEYMQKYRDAQHAKGLRLIKMWVPEEKADEFFKTAAAARAAKEAQT